MTTRLRNPFKVRTSEKIDSDVSFLRIYSPSILDTLIEKQREEKLWNNVLFIRSSPGAGKTSLLRIFEPNTLVALFNNRSQAKLKDLKEYLRKLGVLDNDSIKLLGISLQCTRNYEILEDLPINDVQKKRLFFALLNARIVTATLRGIITLQQKSFPNDLEKITINYKNEHGYFRGLQFPCNGQILYKWAEDIEAKVYAALDSFLPIEKIQPEGHEELFAFNAFSSDNIFYSGNLISERILFMFDDTHKLSVKQRKVLITYIIEQRREHTIWISERLEALSPKENLRSYLKRDYEEINLEEIWQNKESKFRNIVSNVASRRAEASSEDINSFEEHLEEYNNEEAYDENYEAAYAKSIGTIHKIASFNQTHKFDNWITYLEEFEGTKLERAWMARSTEIVVRRHVDNRQLSLDVPFTVNELKSLIASDIKNASEYLISHENNIPYYYGFERLVKLSSFNIDQFLQLSADLYESMLSKSMLSNKIAAKSITLTTSEQEKIIRRVVNQRWKELNILIPYAEPVKKFLTKVQEFAFKETNRTTVPYAPGVTGFAIKAPNNTRLIPDEHWLENERFSGLINVLSTCLSYNLLEKRTIKQGKRGAEAVDVFYLNRWLCMYFKLPLGYGGWRHIKSDELLKWTK
ncbi:ORC-CDC6 family AAA ATPase [Hymenobacter rigui]|uniref:Uncharacterized protein n=1 Tax=Hymenobacter rigui TaxID=334424 RepID=A0A3R9P9Z6_9BACT|nr:hypothetical protein [Hymenobacter rigui]RSK47469.1 hypothetical protein EI291_14505 [Hymenobacter rigui]